MRCVRHGRTCGEPQPIVHCPSNGRLYLVRRLIGRGGFARVYRVSLVPLDAKPAPSVSSPTAPLPSQPPTNPILPIAPPLSDLANRSHDRSCDRPRTRAQTRARAERGSLRVPPDLSHPHANPVPLLSQTCAIGPSNSAIAPGTAGSSLSSLPSTVTSTLHSTSSATPSPSLSTSCILPSPTSSTSTPQRYFALKVISKCTLGGSPAGHEALRNEVTIHQKLTHPSIVSLITYWEDQSRVYLLMDLVDGPSLEEHVTSRGRLSEGEACAYAAQVLEALSYLHANKIVHKDLKLGNLILSANLSRVYLCDFGLSAHIDTTSMIHKSPMCGTPNYVAPELLVPSSSNNSSNSNTPSSTAISTLRSTMRRAAAIKSSTSKDVSYSLSADVWSMGIALYIMLVGYGPFDSDDVNKTFRRIRTARFTFPVGVKLSVAAKSLIRTLLAENPTKRPSADHALHHVFFATEIQPTRNVSRALKEIPAHTDARHMRFERNRKISTSIDASSEVTRDSETNPPIGDRDSGDRDSDAKSTRPNATVWRERRRTSMATGRTEDRRVGRPRGERVASLTGQGVAGRNERRSVGPGASSRVDGLCKEMSARKRCSVLAGDIRTEFVALSVALSSGLVKGRASLDEASNARTSETARMALVKAACTEVNGARDAPPLVRRWLDYTSKYGFATLMEDGRVGCCFNDGSIMFLLSDAWDAVPDVAYVAARGTSVSTNLSASVDGIGNGTPTSTAVNTGDVNDMSKKACLCTLFADMMMDGRRGSMHDLPSACNVSLLKPEEEVSWLGDGYNNGVNNGNGMKSTLNSNKMGSEQVVHVRECTRFRHAKAAAFRLSNQSVHVKFDVGEDACDDYVFDAKVKTVFYREARSGGLARVCSIDKVADLSKLSERVYAQLVVCSQAVARFLE